MSASDRSELRRNSNKSALLTGVATIFDFTGSLGPRRNSSEDHQQAANDALARSWQAVGDALQTAMGRYELPQSPD